MSARWVLPISGDPIPAGAVHVRDGRIAAVSRSTDLRPAPDAWRIDLGPAALMPGLVNAHSHLELTLLRGLFEDLDFAKWIRALTATKYGSLSAGDYDLSARCGAAAAIRAGITTLGDASDSGAMPAALQESGLRGIVFCEVFGPDPRDHEERFEQYLRLLGELRAKETSLVRIGVSPHSPYTVSPPLLRRVAELASEQGLPLSIHAAESRAEKDLLSRGIGPFAEHLASRGITWSPPGVSAVQYLQDVGVLRARPLLVHMVSCGPEDFTALRTSGASIAHCPKSNAKLCHGTAPLMEYLEAGIPVGLGTDGAVSSNGCDLLEEARFAVLLQRSRSGLDPQRLEGLGARRALRLLTLGGAEALGLSTDIGSLEIGKQADMIAVDLSGLHVEPVHDPEAAVAFAASGRDVTWSMVGGRVIFEADAVKTLDESALRRELRSRLERKLR